MANWPLKPITADVVVVITKYYSAKHLTPIVMVYVQLLPYPGTQTPSNFVTLARMPGSGWTVIAEGTGP